VGGPGHEDLQKGHLLHHLLLESEVQSHGGRRVVAGGRCGVVLLLNLWSTRLYSDSTFWLLVSLNLAPQFWR
jgi:hypothetical protein